MHGHEGPVGKAETRVVLRPLGEQGGVSTRRRPDDDLHIAAFRSGEVDQNLNVLQIAHLAA